MSPRILPDGTIDQFSPEFLKSLAGWNNANLEQDNAYELWKTQNPEAYQLSQIPEPGYMGTFVNSTTPTPIMPPPNLPGVPQLSPGMDSNQIPMPGQLGAMARKSQLAQNNLFGDNWSSLFNQG